MMARLINADALMERVLPTCYFPTWFKEKIDEEPTVDAVPVVHAHWIKIQDERIKELNFNECSNCHEKVGVINLMGITLEEKYCSHCGAKMKMNEDGDNDENCV